MIEIIIETIFFSLICGTIISVLHIFHRLLWKKFDPTVFVVIAHRHGENATNHSRIVGVFSKRILATIEADMKELESKGKYVCVVAPLVLDETQKTSNKIYF